MTRPLLAALVSLSILCGFASCGKVPLLPDGGVDICSKENLQSTPTLCPDRLSLGFGQEFGTGTKIGAAPQNTISIRNNSTANLEVASATLTGDSAFTLAVGYDTDAGTAHDLPVSIAGNKYLYLQVIFAPTQAKAYNASITVASNAGNAPMQVFALSGCGVPTDGGSSPCYADGGAP
jgi:hypothetical protein